MTIASLLTLVLASVVPVAPVSAAPDPAPSELLERLTVPFGVESVEPLARALAVTDASVVHADARLGYAVVATRDPAAFEAAYGSPLERDPRGGVAVSAVAVNAPLDPLFALQWGPQVLAMPRAWAIQPGSTAVKVAVIDGGVNRNHPDLVAASITFGRDYVDLDYLPYDESGHGSHVTGIIAATRDNAAGIAGMATVDILVLRVVNAFNSGYCSDFAAAVQAAADAGAHVINFSLFCASYYAPLAVAIASATNQGIVVVAAAGNFWANSPQYCPVFPASLPGTIAVAAVDQTLNAAPYSCRGGAVELAAPGSGIYSTVLGSDYASFSGTSMATPHVAAAAALLKSKFPTMTGSEIRARLAATATDLGPSGRDAAFGHGLINPAAALAGSVTTL